MRWLEIVGWCLCLVQSIHAEEQTGTIKSDLLGKMLTHMGYEPRTIGKDLFQITIEKEGWPVHIMVSVSENEEQLWLESKFLPISANQPIKAEVWKSFLQANRKIGPAFFVFDETDQRIHLYRSIENESITPHRLRKVIDQFDQTVRNTKDLWGADLFRNLVTVGPMPREVVRDASSITLAELLAPSPREIRVVRSHSETELGPMPREVVSTDPSLAPMPREVDPYLARQQQQLLGVWQIRKVEIQGKRIAEEILREAQPSMIFLQDRVLLSIGGESRRMTVQIRNGATIYEIDFTDEAGKLEKGIFKHEADGLHICFSAPNETRPTDFRTDTSKTIWLLHLVRSNHNP